MCEAWTTIGHDPENELIILTSTDPYWIGDSIWNLSRMPRIIKIRMLFLTHVWHDARKVVDNWIYDIEVPTIGAINGPRSALGKRHDE